MCSVRQQRQLLLFSVLWLCVLGSVGLAGRWAHLSLESPANGARFPTDSMEIAALSGLRVSGRVVTKDEREGLAQCSRETRGFICLVMDGREMECSGSFEAGLGHVLYSKMLTTVSVGVHEIKMCLYESFGWQKKNCSEISTFHVVQNAPFELSLDWSPVEEWHILPSGLEFKIDLSTESIPGNSKLARIPTVIKLPVQIVTESFTDQPLLKMFVDVNLQRVNSFSASSQVLQALQKTGNIADYCIESISVPDDPVQFFLQSRSQLTLSSTLKRSPKECQCFRQVPCPDSHKRLEQCNGNIFRLKHPAIPSREELRRACSVENSDYIACTIFCSGHVNSREGFKMDGRMTKIGTVEFLSKLEQYKINNHSIPGQSSSIVCINCVVRHGVIEIVTNLQNKAGRKMVLAKNRFAPYYGWPSGGVHYASFIDANEEKSIFCHRLIEDPVIIISAWSVVNVYHLISDVLIPAFQTLGAQGYQTNDTILLLEIGHGEERSKLQEILHHARSGDTPLSMLPRLFRDVIGLESIRSANESFCFKTLFVEADVSSTPHYFAHSNHPTQSMIPEVSKLQSSFDMKNLEKVLRTGKQFSTMLRANLGLDRFHRIQADNRAPLITIVKRHSTRKISSFAKMKEVSKTVLGKHFPKFKWKEVSFERIPFSKQLEILGSTDIFVCVHGAGCANLAFLPPHAVIVLIMPRGWFGWRWMYSNLGRALGYKVVVHEYLDTNKTAPLDEGWDGTDDDYNGCDIFGFHPKRDKDIELDISGWVRTLMKACDVLDSNI